MEKEKPFLPDILFDKSIGKSYIRKGFFGKGGFAKCYHIVDTETNNAYAGKFIPKKLLLANAKHKMVQEIEIHRTLSHKNVVKFYDFFDDRHYVYIILELCKNRSLWELYKRRKTITDYECRYYMHQTIEGVKYLHEKRIIHRDLKLGNLFLDDMLHVKIGDFGLATRVEENGANRLTLCGTPNYIAPEILTKKGHSFEVDIWSLGCIMFSLLVGQPPFETSTVEETYAKIKKCEYRTPSFLCKSAVDMISAMLRASPAQRPRVWDLQEFEFLSGSKIPSRLPTCCLTMPPRLETIKKLKPVVLTRQKQAEYKPTLSTNKCLEPLDLKQHTKQSYVPNVKFVADKTHCYDFQQLCLQLRALAKANIKILAQDLDIENSDPAAQPLYWISKWVDYSEEYGFSYQLCDDSMGVMFNDMTKLILLPNHIDVHYIDFEGRESYMTTKDFCTTLAKKMKLLGLFKRYMTENLVNTTTNNVLFERDALSRMPHLHAWFRTKSGVCMFLSNGTVQLNFSDHMKLIFCPRMKAVTCIDSEKNFRTYRFSTIIENGCSKAFFQRLVYACDKIKKLVDKME